MRRKCGSPSYPQKAGLGSRRLVSCGAVPEEVSTDSSSCMFGEFRMVASVVVFVQASEASLHSMSSGPVGFVTADSVWMALRGQQKQQALFRSPLF